MAKKEKNSGSDTSDVDNVVDFTSELIKDLNKSAGERVAYNLNELDAPTIVKRWIPTGSVQLDYAIRNSIGGGYPEGRIIEIAGMPSVGKSHLGYHAAAIVQKMGGLVVYIDTENATPIDKLAQMGIDVRKRFVYVDSHMTESVFSVIETTILKAKQIPASKNIPILVIWDSVAATSPKAELEGEYEANTMGLQARVISKGMRKIVGVIGQNNVTLLCLNQLRTKFGVMPHSDPYCVDPKTTIVKIRCKKGSKFDKILNKEKEIV
jgi:recombination protein RecA